MSDTRAYTVSYKVTIKGGSPDQAKHFTSLSEALDALTSRDYDGNPIDSQHSWPKATSTTSGRPQKSLDKYARLTLWEHRRDCITGAGDLAPKPRWVKRGTFDRTPEDIHNGEVFYA